MKKIFLFLIALAVAGGINAQTVEIISGGQVVASFNSSQYSEVVFRDTTDSEVSGRAMVSGPTGRRYCDYVQLWAGGPKWATFNVGAVITDYAHLIVCADNTPHGDQYQADLYFNTFNVGGLYAWNNPNMNGRQTTWNESVSTGIADVATTLWGSNWKTPTRQQLDTLQGSSYGKTTWTLCNGRTTQYVAGCTLAGYKVSGVGEYADKSIFLPFAGLFDYENRRLFNVNNYGYYRSSTAGDSDTPCCLFIRWSGNMHEMASYDDRFGQSVRAILAQ